MPYRPLTPLLALACLPAVGLGELPWTPSDALVISGVSRSGRIPFFQDTVQALLVEGRWETPIAGNILAGPDGAERRWESAAGKDGVFDHPALRGGWAFLRYESPVERIAVLEAAGHGVAMINGTPRVGDPYQNGMVRVPVLLRKGSNDLLFTAGRGRLSLRLSEPPSPAFFNLSDPTFPDLVPSDHSPVPAAVVVVNASSRELRGAEIRAAVGDGPSIATQIPSIPPLGVRKVGFTIDAPAGLTQGDHALQLTLVHEGRPTDLARSTIQVRDARSPRRVTFVSGIDGSVQYYGLNPARTAGEGKALILTLHGASVEGIGQASAYGGKDWAHLVAPTNRRPFGFDWEDWGRMDALEVLGIARESLGTDPSQTYLTGHSMGGHGTWHLGATFPGHWAAIAPSAGWISFFTYGGMPRLSGDAVADILARAVNGSDTHRLLTNYRAHAVYVLHGDADDNVPVSQAREMRKLLEPWHPDFHYHEQPGAGHWWGGECVDWPPIMELFQGRRLAKLDEVDSVDFVTANPAVSSKMRWIRVEQQEVPLAYSRVQFERKAGTLRGTTENVRRLHLGAEAFLGLENRSFQIDGQTVPAGVGSFEKVDGTWRLTWRPMDSQKSPMRAGPFKEAFQRRFVFVYGTSGTTDENAWAIEKARFDAETFWYRGNGSVDVVSDDEFLADPARFEGRNPILFGNRDTNRAWRTLLADSPITVVRGVVTIQHPGSAPMAGDDLVCLVVRPLPGDPAGLVAAVAPTGMRGAKLADRLPYFVSGVAYPDWTVLGADSLRTGIQGIRGAGFFDHEWRYAPSMSALR
jgi:hypothetical protein